MGAFFRNGTARVDSSANSVSFTSTRFWFGGTKNEVMSGVCSASACPPIAATIA